VSPIRLNDILAAPQK